MNGLNPMAGRPLPGNAKESTAASNSGLWTLGFKCEPEPELNVATPFAHAYNP